MNTQNFDTAIKHFGLTVVGINRANGWNVTIPQDWGNAYKLASNLALIHSEVSEALEAVRKNDRANFEEEMADVMIRVIDTCHGLGVDLGPVIRAKLEANKKRGYRHGGKAI